MSKNINKPQDKQNGSTMKENNDIMESFAHLIENVMDKSEVVLAAEAVTDQLQDMAEKLAMIQAKDVMQMQDSVTTAFGQEVANQFNSVASAQITQLIAAIQGAKSAIDSETQRMKQGVEGGDMSDIGMMGNEPSMGSPEGDEQPMDAAGGPDANLPEVPPDMSGNVDDDALGADDNFAGRARKESAKLKGKMIESKSNPYDRSNPKETRLHAAFNKGWDGASGNKTNPYDVKTDADLHKAYKKGYQHWNSKDGGIKESTEVAEDFLGANAMTGIDGPAPTHTPPAEHKSPFHDDNLSNANEFHGGAGKCAHEIAAMVRNEPITGNERKALSNILSHFCSVCHDPSHWGIDTETKLTAALKANGLYEINKPAVAKIVDKMRELVGIISHAHRSMTESAIKRLRKSDNPDAMIFETFRKKLTETRDAQLAAIRTARTFAIDIDDVVSIVREAAKEAGKCSACKGTGKVKGPSPFYKAGGGPAEGAPKTHKCDVCKGSGKAPKKEKVKETAKVDCSACKGTGHHPGQVFIGKHWTKADECKKCDGTGKAPDKSMKKKTVKEEEMLQNVPMYPVGAKSTTDMSGGTSAQTPGANGVPQSVVQQPTNQSSSTVKSQSPEAMRMQPNRSQVQQPGQRGDTANALRPKPSVYQKPQPMVDDGRHQTMVPPQEKEEGSDVPQEQRQRPFPNRQVQKQPNAPSFPGKV